MDLDLGQTLAAQPASSDSKSHLVSANAGDQTLNVEPGLYALSSDAAAGITITARIGAAAVMPVANVPQTGVVIPAGATRFLLVRRTDAVAATDLAALHYIASAAGPSSLWIVRVVPQ